DPAGQKILISQLIANSELNDEMRANFVMMVGYHLTEKEPLRALDLYMSAISRLTISADRARSLVGFTLEKLAGSNPQQALDWVERNKTDHPELIDDLTKVGILSGIAKSDASLAFSSLEKFGMSENPQALERIGGGASSAEERSAVLAAMRDYTNRAGSEEERQIAMKSTLAGMAAQFSQAGFDSASKWLETEKLSPEEAAGLSGGIDASLAKGDTGRWIDWMSGVLPVDQLGTKVDELVKFWTQEDYRSAGAWLENVPEGATRDAAVKAYAGTVASADPGVAAQWALTLPAGDERTNLMKNIYGEWKKQDERAAGDFARDNGIGE
ncbi:MAG: hypothetical protein JWO82_187, partial [Akkermansiaceae bacterium]|nr:hypothetical protein [Akkermansiaceae bacterium]